MEKINIAIVDDHQLVSSALEKMLSLNESYSVTMDAPNGRQFLESLKEAAVLPDVVLMDINMPVQDGIETTAQLRDGYPSIKVIALTMEDNETTIIKMLKAGAKGYLLKDMSPETLFDAIDIVHKKGVFYTDLVSQSLLKIKTEEKHAAELHELLRDRELDFIRLACSELTYREIADKMFLSPRTIDGYRDSVFLKLNVKTRVGIVLYALKHNLCDN